MARAVIIGGTGAIGRATARRLLATGWSVDLTGRDPGRMPHDIAAAGGRFIAVDTRDAGRLRASFGDGADLLVDCVCFTAEDAAGLLPLARDSASTVMISSKAVYVDAAGRHSNSPVKPDFGGPVREDQPTVVPGYGDYRSAEGYPAGKVAAGLGYTPAGDYAATVAAEVDWLIAAAQGGEDADLIPGPEDEYFAALLDYRGEDRWLMAQTASAG